MLLQAVHNLGGKENPAYSTSVFFTTKNFQTMQIGTVSIIVEVI